MHKSAVSFGVSSGGTKGKEVIIVVSTNNLRPTFNNKEVDVPSMVVLIVGIMLASVVSPCRS